MEKTIDIRMENETMSLEERLTIPEAVKVAYSALPANMNKFVAREIVITGVILYMHPECIEDQKRLPRNFAKQLSRELGMNRSLLSRAIPALSVRYKVFPDDRMAVTRVLDALNEGWW